MNDVKYNLVCSGCGKNYETELIPISEYPNFCDECYDKRHKTDRMVWIPGELVDLLHQAQEMEKGEHVVYQLNEHVIDILRDYCRSTNETQRIMYEAAIDHEKKVSITMKRISNTRCKGDE